MEFLTVLVDDLTIPHYVDYFCTNDKCDFSLRIDFDEFNKRIIKNDTNKKNATKI